MLDSSDEGGLQEQDTKLIGDLKDGIQIMT